MIRSLKNSLVFSVVGAIIVVGYLWDWARDRRRNPLERYPERWRD